MTKAPDPKRTPKAAASLVPCRTIQRIKIRMMACIHFLKCFTLSQIDKPHATQPWIKAWEMCLSIAWNNEPPSFAFSTKTNKQTASKAPDKDTANSNCLRFCGLNLVQLFHQIQPPQTIAITLEYMCIALEISTAQSVLMAHHAINEIASGFIVF